MITREPMLAYDRDSVRSYDVDGRLHVDRTPISKATVNEYFGREIPGSESLGLKPDWKYKLLRDPDELKRAADSFNNIPLLRRHVSVSADDHKPDDVIGSTGTDAEFVHPYLMNSLVVWAKNDITQIEDDVKKELSSAYRYRADMTPGNFEGQSYDGVMRDITANHVSLVVNGRAGHDVVVGDSKPETFYMAATNATARRVNAIKAFFAPRIAKDQSMDGLEHILALDADPEAGEESDRKARDAEEEKEKKEKEAADRKAKDAEEDDKKKAADKKAKDESEAEEKKAADRKARDEKRAMDRKGRDESPEGFKGWLKNKVDAEDYAKACDMLDGERKADDEASAMSSTTEKDPDPENTNGKGAKDKKAMDEDTVKSLVAAERRNQQAIYEARNAVRPRVGELTLAFDSAEDVYKTALEASGVKTAGVHPSAYKAMFGMLPSRNVETLSDRRLAMDAASSTSFAKRFPGAASIRLNS